MSTQVQHRRGTAVQHEAFTGAMSEITHDTTGNNLRVHDGAKVGGYRTLMEQELGVAGGIATLDNTGNVPEAQLGNVPKSYDYASTTALAAAEVPATITYARTAGYSAVGDGGEALYKRVASEPSHAGKVQSADGAWWAYVPDNGIVNVRCLGAIGDGASHPLSERFASLALAQAVYSFASSLTQQIDWAAAQAAVSMTGVMGGGEVYFSAGEYSIAQVVNLPLVDMKVSGAGSGASRLFGSSGIIKFPTSTKDADGIVRTQDISGLTFDQKGNGISVDISQIWDPAGKAGPRITNNKFINSSATTTTAECIRLSGVWAAIITNNYFQGRAGGGGPTDNIGGYGIRAVFTSDMNSSVMNIVIADNNIVSIANPIFINDRVVSEGGRCEGLKITGNQMAAGNTGIRLSATTATNITGNQISDYYNAIDLVGDFYATISGNSEITGRNSAIRLLGVSNSIVSGISISGNTIGSPGVGVRLSQSSGFDQGIRSVSITGNTFNGVAGPATAVGVSLEGANSVTHVVISGNSFEKLNGGIYFRSVDQDIVVIDNVFSEVTTKYTDQKGVAKRFSATSVKTLVGGVAEYVDVAIPTGYFNQKPSAAFLSGTGNEGLLGWYDYDSASTTATNLHFYIMKRDGTSFAAGGRRFSVVAYE